MILGDMIQNFGKHLNLFLGEAKESGIHEPKNYALAPTMYCGLKIDYNPYFDPLL